MVVHGSPQSRLRLRVVVARAVFPADGADVLFPFVWAQVNDDVFRSILALTQVDILHNRVVDIAENLG